MKTCKCCKRTFTSTQWADLPIKGYQDDRDVYEDGELIELRNCSCGTTLAVVLDGPLKVWNGPVTP